MANALRIGSSRQERKQNRSKALKQACERVFWGRMGLEGLEVRQLLSTVLTWNFDDQGAGGNVLDSSGNGLNGYIPDLSYNINFGAGKSNSAVIFDSSASMGWNGAITTTTALSDALANTGSLAVWVKTTAVGNNSFWLAPTITGIENTGGGKDIAWGWLDASGRIGLQVSDDGSIKSLSPINDGQWHHIAITRDAGSGVVKMYVDGFLNSTATYSKGAMNVSDSMPVGFSEIGALTSTGGNKVYFEGALDELNVYNHVLSDAEVAKLFDPAQQPPSAPTALTVAGAGTTGIKLSWTNTAENASSYIIERSPDGNASTFAPIAEVAVAQSFTDRGLTPNTTYYYRVRASNYFGKSAYTNVVPATTIPVAAPGNGTGLLGMYYDNGGQTNPNLNQSLLFTGLVFTRIDPTVNFNWGNYAPDPRMGVDQFSVKWIGEVQAQYTENYTFYTLTDDGAFFYIDLNDGMGLQKIIDDPYYHGATAGTDDKSSEALKPGGVQLVAGQKYKIMMVSFEDGGGAAANLFWESLSTPRQIIPKSQLFPATFTSAPTAVSGLSATPGNGLAGLNNIVLSWNESQDAIGYRVLRSESAGGPWLEIGRVGGSTYTDPVSAGKTYYYKLIAFNSAGESAESNVASASSASLPTAADGLLGMYWDNRTLNGAPLVIRVDSSRLDSANGGAPVAGTGAVDWPDIDGDPDFATGVDTIDDGVDISVRWQGTITVPTDGTYSFWTRTDDDVRLYIGGNRLIAAPDANNFTAGRGAPGAPGDGTSIYLKANTPYPIMMEYNQGGGGAVAELRWAGPSIATALIPAVYNGKTLLSSAIVPTAAPTNLSATIASSAVGLTWTDPSMSEQGFYVEMSTDGGTTWSRYATLGQLWNATPSSGTPFPTSTGRYVINGLTPNTAYSFRVKSYNLAGESAYSNVLNVTTPAPAVDALVTYPFSESSGTTTKDSTNTYTANLTASTRFTSRGRAGNAIKFLGDGHVDAGNIAQFNPTTQISVAAWINAYDWGGNRRILQKGNGDNQYRLLAETVTVNGQSVQMLKWHIAGVGEILAPLPSTGMWHHVAATYDGSALRLYVDGVEAAPAVAASGLIPVTQDNLIIGSKAGTGAVGDRFYGKIDDVRIYDTALDASTISALAAETPVVAPSNLEVLVPVAPDGLFRLDLRWKDNSTENFPSFKFLRTTTPNDPASWVEIPVAVDGNTYSDSTVEPNTTYYYKVVAFNRLGQAESAVASAKTLVAPPGVLNGTSSGLSGTIDLTATGTIDWAKWGSSFESAGHVVPDTAVIAQTPFSDYIAWEAENAVTVTDPDLDGRTGRVIDGSTTPTAGGTSSTAASNGKALLIDEDPSVKRGQAFMTWTIKVTEPGYYRLYARRRIEDLNAAGGNGDNDSIQIPTMLNVPPDPTGAFHGDWAFGGDANFGWTNSGKDYFVSTPGTYTFTIGCREGGVVLDRIVLSKNTGLSTANGGILDTMTNSQVNGEINYSIIGTAAPTTLTGPATFTWSDGSVAATGNTSEGAAVAGAGNGFRIQVPARSFNRKLRVYLGVGANSQGQLVAKLSDGSAAVFQPVVVDNSGSSTVRGQTYELEFRSGVDNQTLTLEWKSVTGTVALFGATWIEMAAPAGATNVKAEPISRYDMALTWTDNSPNETGFRIERSSDGGSSWQTAGVAPANSRSFVDRNVYAGTKYRVVAFNGFGDGTASNVVDGAVLRDPEGPWQTQDIGAVGIMGDAVIDPASGTARLTASGSDFWDVGNPNVGDQGRFLYQQVTGDFTITAHVLPFDRWNEAGTDVSNWIKAGVMVRKSLDGLSQMVDMVVTPENQMHTQWRPTDGAAGAGDPASNLYNRSGWVRLQRSGGMIYTFWSADGVTWYPGSQPALSSSTAAQGTQRVSLPDTVYVGLALTSHNNGQLATVLFDNVSLVTTAPATPTAPSNLVATPISGDRVSLIWQDNSNNETQFVVERNDGSGTWTEIGRTETNIVQFIDKGPLTDGQVYSYRVSAARYTNVSASSAVASATTKAGEALPAAWTAANLTTTQPNVYAYDSASDTIDMTVSAGDHWGNADSIGYIYQNVSGDFSITTKVASQEITGPWAKSGIAIRESADANAKAVSFIVTPSNGIQFMWRDSTGGSTTGIYTYEIDRRNSGLYANFTAPMYLRLTKVGDDITASFSMDGVTWTQYGKHTLAMNPSLTAGITHTSNNGNGASGVATFVGTAITTPQLVTGTADPFNYSSFANSNGLTLNGYAAVANNRLVILPGANNVRGSAFVTTPRDVTKFNASFDFQLPMSSGADGFAFVIQGQSPMFVGGGGGALGYSGYNWVNQNAMAIKFDIYNNLDQTGLYINNSMNDNGPDLRGNGIDLDSGRVYHVDISVDGSTVKQTITDVLAPLSSFTATYTITLNGNPVDLPTLLGSKYGYLGFTSANGGLFTSAQILNFAYEAQAVTPPSINIAGTAAAETWYVKRDGADVKVWNNADGSGAPAQTVAFATMTDFNINGGGEADTLVLDLTGGALFPASGLNVAGGKVKLQLVGGDSVTLPAVQLGAGASLDLGTNDLVIQNATYADIAALVASARAGSPRWTGPGIGTSDANADQGLVLDQVGADVKIKFTWNGDLNMDGRVNADDYFYIDQGFLQKPQPPKYHDGDFNFDGKINADDYFLIDQAFLNQKGQILSAPKPALAETVTATKKTAARKNLFSRLKVRKHSRVKVRFHA